MTGNIIIIIIATVIIGYAKKVFSSELAKKPIHYWSAIVLVFTLILTIVIPNIQFFRSPFTPQIHGKVIDDVTKEPISDAIVMIEYGYSFGEFPMHSSGRAVKEVVITTGKSGEFVVHKRLRNLAITLFPLYSRDSGGVGITILHRDYKLNYVPDEIIDTTVIVEMKKDKDIHDVATDNYDLSMLADLEARRGKDITVKAIRKVMAEKDKQIATFYVYKGN